MDILGDIFKYSSMTFVLISKLVDLKLLLFETVYEILFPRNHNMTLLTFVFVTYLLDKSF